MINIKRTEAYVKRKKWKLELQATQLLKQAALHQDPSIRALLRRKGQEMQNRLNILNQVRNHGPII